MREIVTIQVGSYANFVGSHFWNFQDELLGLAEDPQSDEVFKTHHLDMDVLYRSGETPQGILTYTPRLVSVDCPGSLGSMSSRGMLYSDIPPVHSDVFTWTGKISTHTTERPTKNLFLQSLHQEEQDKTRSMCGTSAEKNDSESEIPDEDIVLSLQSGVKYWTDYSKVHYHPQSLYELKGFGMDMREFDTYGSGRDAISEALRGEEIDGRLRFFMEECDHVQGIQFIVDDSGGFSGVAAGFLENIADDYTNIPMLLFSVRSPVTYVDPTNWKQTVSQNLHDAISFAKLSSLCKLIVPIGLPSLSGTCRFLSIEDEKPYHSSAVYASALHSISLPFRMELLGPSAESYYTCGAVDVNGLIQMLAGQARHNKAAILDVAMPAPPLTGRQAERSLLGNLQTLTPEIADNDEDLQAVESLTIHGAIGSGTLQATISEVKDGVEAAYEHAMTRPKFSHLSVARCPLPIPLPFPSIFGNRVGQHGELLRSPISGSSARGSLDVHSIPMAARLRSSTAVLPFLENRLGNLRRFGMERGALGAQIVRSWGFGKEDVEDIGEALSTMVSTLDPRLLVSSDSD